MDMSPAFSISRLVQFGDTDMAGVLHHSNYFRLMEEVEHAFWRSLGRSVVHLDGETHVSWPRARVSCEYHAPARFEDMLTLRFRIMRLGEKSMQYEVEFDRGAARLALGKVTAVCCTMTHGRFQSVPIPEALRALLKPHVVREGEREGTKEK